MSKIESFNKSGKDYELKEVTRRKECNCKLCNNKINPGDKAKVLSSDGIMGTGIMYCVGVFHLECYPKFEL